MCFSEPSSGLQALNLSSLFPLPPSHDLPIVGLVLGHYAYDLPIAASFLLLPFPDPGASLLFSLSLSLPEGLDRLPPF